MHCCCKHEGLGNGVQRAQVLSFSDEDLLWSLGLLRVHSPEVLLNTVVVMLGMSCALRAREEHRNLQSPPFKSQISFCYDEQGKLYFKYTRDFGLKTSGNWNQKRSLCISSVIFNIVLFILSIII